MTVKENIESKMNKAINCELLEVIDESHKHAGHSGARPEGETHFHINLISSDLKGKSRVDCQRMVYKILADELAGPIHALSLNVKASEE